MSSENKGILRTLAGKLVGTSLGATVYNYVAAAALLGLLMFGAYILLTGKYWKWQANRANDRADVAEENAATAQGNADRANGAAGNATLTRQNMDRGKLDITVTTNAAAARAEKYDPTNDPDYDGGVSPELVRELEAAQNRARAASDRLQRKGAGR